MNQKLEIQVEMDDQGRLVLPSEFVARYKLKPGTRICLEDNGNGLIMQPKFSIPAKVYVEPTNRCNLECRTCMRNVWEESTGEMSGSTFARIIEGLQAFSPVPRVFFGGLGEPLVHPNIIEMVAQAKGLGEPVKLITNGTLLSQPA